ncbi:unnamed protein product [Mytilus coruscus]|uniref:Endonuclease/exonuclease/phosphatase domain-containing protein n=1 Tax=Mytilus coruscus TaxID=42192 RepID=A0A6J8CV28_MYTCO|nr:unnamed protein product [Mytilus coruscus]
MYIDDQTDEQSLLRKVVGVKCDHEKRDHIRTLISRIMKNDIEPPLSTIHYSINFAPVRTVKGENQDCSKEDILWIKLQEKGSTLCFCLCVCYLPPEGSSRWCDPETFFADLLYQVYKYQNEGTVCISGDFNSRIGYNTDFIEGVDRIPSREVIDKTENHYGDLFVDFLVDSNFCVLNDRIGNENNYTCVSKKGKSVVDYVVVPHESIPSVSDFKVNTISDLIDRYNMDVPDKTSDHSILEWKLAVMNEGPNDEPAFETQFKGNKRYDTSKLSTEFLNSEDCVKRISETVNRI